MPTYRIGIHGENCWVALEGEPQKLGFYTFRFVDAANPDLAGRMAMDSILAELKNKVSNKEDDAPVLSVDEVAKASFLARLLAKIRSHPGFIWFPSELESSG